MLLKNAGFCEQKWVNNKFHWPRSAENFKIFHWGVFTTFHIPSKPRA